MKWKKTEKDGLVYYTLPHWQERGAKIVMTTRSGGVGKAPYDTLNLGYHVDDDKKDVGKNREKLLAALGGNPSRFAAAKQVHGCTIQKIAADNCRGFYSHEDAFDDTDGLFTAEKGIWLATFYADCLPLAVFHPEKKLLGLAHAGWKGTYQDIGGALIEAMAEEASLDPSELWCALGAGIGSCCYEVDETFFERFCRHYEKAESWFTRFDGGKPHFDNVRANVDLFTEKGVKRENISCLDLCTCCHRELFFSYRRDEGKTGRHGLLGALI